MSHDLTPVSHDHAFISHDLKLKVKVNVHVYTLNYLLMYYYGVHCVCTSFTCRVLEVLSGIAEGREEIDMERMSSIIKRKIKNVLNQVS